MWGDHEHSNRMAATEGISDVPRAFDATAQWYVDDPLQNKKAALTEGEANAGAFAH
jgi:hypothetical protein